MPRKLLPPREKLPVKCPYCDERFAGSGSELRVRARLASVHVSHQHPAEAPDFRMKYFRSWAARLGKHVTTNHNGGPPVIAGGTDPALLRQVQTFMDAKASADAAGGAVIALVRKQSQELLAQSRRLTRLISRKTG